MENINMKFVIVVVCLAVCIGASWAGIHDGAKANEEKAKKAAAEIIKAAKDSAKHSAKHSGKHFGKHSAKHSAASSDKSDKVAEAPAVDAPAPGPATEESETFGEWAYEKFTG